ncbi:hypothetical protein ACR9YC_05115 [Parasphingorhabdus sp. DH2-15]|uniref:hypothetical protein n=1 Tax=Parasphingorhabdus sp. DH2-15 TaxID=3444112 RepID=UPI003F68266A
MNTPSKPSFKFYGKNSARTITAMFAMLFITGLMLLVRNSFDDIEPIADIANPLASSLALIIGVPIISFGLVIASNLDRRCTEDYTFQLMANAAQVAVITMLALNLLSSFDFLNELTGLRELQKDDMIGITLVSWATAYFIFRQRGLK